MGTTSIINETLINRAKISGKNEAVFDVKKNKRYSFDDLLNRASQLSYFLKNQLHLKKGDRIAFCAENSVEFIDSFYMSSQTGIIITTYNYLLNSKEISNMMKNEEPSVLFYCSKSFKKINLLAKEHPNCCFISLEEKEDNLAEYLYLDIMNNSQSELVESIDLSLDDIQMLIHTGGTTGIPKAAKISYQSIMFNAISEILTLDLTSADCSLLMLPFYHTAAWNVLTLPILYAGGRVIILGGFSEEQTFDLIEKEKPTVAIGVETIYKRLMDHSLFNHIDFSGFRWLLSGAAPISYPTMKPYWEKGIKLVNAYGATETGPNNIVHPVNQMSLEEAKEKWGAAGKVMMFNQMKIVDDEFKEVKKGVKGELIWRGPLTFSGYWNQETSAESMLADGWIRSGDIGFQDEDGYIYISGRIKNTIISGGENIYPLEIEKILMSHDLIDDVCIIGVKDDEWGEIGKALVVLKRNQKITKSDIVTYLKQYISPFKIPKYIEFVDVIPKNAVGKTDYPLIHQKYA